MRCAGCGTTVEDGTSACPSCGGDLADAAPAAVAAGDAAEHDANPYAPPAARVEPLRAAHDRPVASPPRPWIRYWARMVDIYLAAIVAGVAAGVLLPDLIASQQGERLFGMAVVFAWIFVETLLLLVFGTTLGKWLLNIRLSTAAGDRLDARQALSRSAKVWWRGLGTGFPLAALFTQIIAHRRLTANGITSWDRDGGFVVVHGPIGWVRATVTVLFFAAFLALVIVGSL